MTTVETRRERNESARLLSTIGTRAEHAAGAAGAGQVLQSMLSCQDGRFAGGEHVLRAAWNQATCSRNARAGLGDGSCGVCGFSSTVHGNQIARDHQRRQLALVVETAAEV